MCSIPYPARGAIPHDGRSLPDPHSLTGGCLISPGPDQASLATSLGINASYGSTASQWDKLPPRILRFALQAAARDLVPAERVSKCLRALIPRSHVDVLYAPAQKSAMYAGLVTCASVWMCPVCSAKITERRRAELAAGLASWTAQEDRRAVLVTFTLQHTAEDSLEAVLVALKASWRAFTHGRWWQEFKSSWSLAGTVAALEVTHGDNGWHPHKHVLFFFPEDVSIIALERELKTRWSQVVANSGKYASYEHGVDVRFSDEDIAGYVAKLGRWSASHEMTKTPAKRGGAGARSVLQLLADAASGDHQAGALWREYALGFKGSKQLVWSRSLRALVGLVEQEKTDEELAAEVEELAVILAQLTWQEWRVVLANDCRAGVLEGASTGGQFLVQAFLV